VPGAQVGQYCLMNMGFSISAFNEDEALETVDLLKQIGSL